MGVYEGIKEAVRIVGEIDNSELYSKLIDVQKEILDLIEENKRLKEEIQRFMDNKELEKEFEYPPGKSYILHKKGNTEIKLCTTCWNSKDNKYSVISMHPSNRFLECRICKSRYDD